MKILDIPQSGKRGLYVSQGGRYGQISRALVIPSNPRTVRQTNVRGILSRVAAGWLGLKLDMTKLESFRPGQPTPTHRMKTLE